MEKDITIDWHRVVKFTALGTFLVGPTLHVWYGFLARRIPSPGFTGTIYRLALDQLVFAPCFIPVFFASALALDGTPDLIIPKIKSDWFTTVMANYAVWVPAQFLNFKYIPPSFQVLFSNSVGFGWNIYFSYMTYKARASAPSAVSMPSASAQPAEGAAESDSNRSGDDLGRAGGAK